MFVRSLFFLLFLGAAATPVHSELLWNSGAPKPAAPQSVSAPKAGIVVELKVGIGDQVTKGQLLAKLNHEAELHAWKIAKLRADNDAEMMIARGELKQKEGRLYEVRARVRKRQAEQYQLTQAEGEHEVALGKFEQAKAAEELQKLDLELADRNLEARFLRSPIDGHVVMVHKLLGDGVNAGETVVIVADLSQLATEIPVTKESAALLKVGGSMPVRLGDGSIHRTGEIAAISPLANAKHGEQVVRVVFSSAGLPHTILAQSAAVVLPRNVKPVEVPKDPGPKPKPAS